MNKLRVFKIIQYAVIGLLGLISISIQPSLAAKKVTCPSGYTLNQTGVTGYMYCLKKIKQTYRSYYTYNPCMAPGVYNTNIEVNSGPTKGRDRCTAVGLIGPALLCGVGQTLEIRQNKKDACYKNNVRYVETFADVILVD